MIKVYLTFITWVPAHCVRRIDIAGKTGTAENFAKWRKRVQLKDHSIF
jgi:cell division protein FtsI/penicillin-binding protein 2